MRSETMLSTLIKLYDVRRPVVITGAPGGGKTSMAKLLSETLDIDYIHLHMPTMLVEDFGVPFPVADSNKFEYRMPHWWPNDPDTKAILCIDDRNQCGPDLQKVLANLIQERELHGHKLPEGVMVVATGNRQSDRAGANRLLTHLADRETELEWDTNLTDWTRWAIDNDVNPTVISFIQFRTALLHDFDPQRTKNPTPRSWVEGVSNIIGVVPIEAEFDCFKGAIGEGPAAEFVGFQKIERSLPNIDALILNPDQGDVPTDPATLYALSGGLAQRATTANFDRVVRYADRMPPEFSVLTVSHAARREPELTDTKTFADWAIKNQSVLF